MRSARISQRRDSDADIAVVRAGAQDIAVLVPEPRSAVPDLRRNLASASWEGSEPAVILDFDFQA